MLLFLGEVKGNALEKYLKKKKFCPNPVAEVSEVQYENWNHLK